MEIEYGPFELNPQIPAEGLDRRAYRTAKFGWEQSLLMDDRLTRMGLFEGLVFKFPAIIRTPNTFNAHRLTKFASRVGVHEQVAFELLKMYFTEALDIGSREMLMEAARRCELDVRSVGAMLDSDELVEDVRSAEKRLQQIGIQSVPHFLVKDSPVANGALKAELLASRLRAVFVSRTV